MYRNTLAILRLFLNLPSNRVSFKCVCEFFPINYLSFSSYCFSRITLRPWYKYT